MPDQNRPDYPINLVLTVNGRRPEIYDRNYADPSYDRQPAAASARAGMNGWAIAAIAFCSLAAFTVLTLALTDNIVLNDAAGRRIDARIEADKAVRLASANIEPKRIEADLEKSLEQTKATVLIAQANAIGTRERVTVVNRVPAQQTLFRDGFRTVAYMAPAPNVVRTSFRDVPSAREIFDRVPHRITRRWAPCVAGYDQDEVTGDCSRTTWHPGPMPRN